MTDMELEEHIQKLRVRSDGSQKRMTRKSSSKTVFGFEKKVDSSLDEDEDSDDTSYVQSSSSESDEYTEEVSIDQVDDLIVDGPVTNTPHQQEDTGDLSDFYPSDVEDEKPTRQSLSKNRQKYSERAGFTVNLWQQMQMFVPQQGNRWIAQLYRFSPEEGRYVNKGPVMLYFVPHPLRLAANYLYGTKSVALNMQLFELMATRYSTLVNKRFVFCSMGHNAIMDAEILSEQVPLEVMFPDAPENVRGLQVLKCTSHLKPVIETGSSLWAISFMSVPDAQHFKMVLDMHLVSVKGDKQQKRMETFFVEQDVRVVQHLSRLAGFKVKATYCQAPAFLVENGLEFFPQTNGQDVVETCICRWCHAVVGPFSSVEDNVYQFHQQASPGCPFVQ